MATLLGFSNIRVLPKNIYKNGKKLSIQELFISPIYYFDLNVEFERLGYEYKDNTENEIYFSVLEFERLVISNDYSLTVKQENFKKRIKSYHQGAYISKGSISDYML